MNRDRRSRLDIHEPSDTREPAWIDAPAAALVSATSEDRGHAAVNAFDPRASTGWRAEAPGVQVITVRFRRPVDVTRLRLVFEASDERTQEFSVSWSARRGEAHGELVRQQFNFAPHGALREEEDYRAELRNIDQLQIRVTPDISGGPAIASLRECRIA